MKKKTTGQPILANDDNRVVVTVAKLAQLVGVTENSIRHNINDGKWLKDKHFYKKGRRIYIDYAEVIDWYRSGDQI